MTTSTIGPDFVSIQVRDRETSAAFYEHVVGLSRVPAPNPVAAVFSADGFTFAVRDQFPGTDLDATGQLGAGIGLWFRHAEPRALHALLLEQGTAIVQEPIEGPFGTQFAFQDPDGYVITIHSQG
ncbi:VOC family protein [Brachybacterium sp. FME24]|uniref:VOC family protein n=1 Tax=Brachybacterium sp. FME24 TaxID=2742605 RepID=UPI00186798C6|nr:VOC family protein [Brachybacterium sp. FME24]